MPFIDSYLWRFTSPLLLLLLRLLITKSVSDSDKASVQYKKSRH